jgi:hypothetical protein
MLERNANEISEKSANIPPGGVDSFTYQKKMKASQLFLPVAAPIVEIINL